MLRFSDGVNVDTSGPLRVLMLSDGAYVVGNQMLIPMPSYEAAAKFVAERK